MTVELKTFVQDKLRNEKMFLEVKEIANRLHQCLISEDILQKINNANQPGNSSRAVQEVLLEEALNLGFVSEKKNLFLNYKTSSLRPDYYMKIGNTGILFEVERGKTTQNNMDLLDLWKCHICKEADYLFLMVPKELRQNSTNTKVEKCFSKVCSRLEPFYQPGNYVNVNACFIFGY